MIEECLDKFPELKYPKDLENGLYRLSDNSYCNEQGYLEYERELIKQLKEYGK